ncbi:MAG: Tat pathway signal sequence domain protein [Hyphomonadaceae bacterium]
MAWNWKHVVLALAVFPVAGVTVAACGGNQGRTMEIPDGPPGTKAKRVSRNDEQARDPNQRPSNWLSRTFGNDDAPNSGPCPLMGVLYDSSRVVEFASAEQRYANIAWTGEMRGVRGFCRYTGTNPIEMNLEVDMAFGRGPAAGESRTHRYRYWVAVTRRGIAPIEKQYYDIDVTFDGDGNIETGTDRIERIVIPRANADVSGENFEILVGFDLTPEQLAYNREGRRFRMDAGTQTGQQVN